MRTLATVSSQNPAAGFIASNDGRSRPERKFFFTYPTAFSTRPFSLPLRNAARGDGEPEVVGKVEVDGVQDRVLSECALEYGRLEIVDHDFGRHAVKRGKGVLMAGKEVFHGLRDGKFDIHPPTVTKDHDKEAEPAAGFSNLDGAIRAPVDLSAFAGGEGELEEGGCTLGANPPDVVFDDGVAAPVAFLPDALQDLDGRVGMRFEHPRDGSLERVELARSPGGFPLAESLLGEPFCDGAGIESEFPGDLSGGEALLLMIVFDLGEEFEIDHRASSAIFFRIRAMETGPSMAGLTSGVESTRGSRSSTW